MQLFEKSNFTLQQPLQVKTPGSNAIIFYGCNLWVLMTVRVFVPGKPFDQSLMFVGKPRPYQQTLFYAGKASQGQILQFITNICKL